MAFTLALGLVASPIASARAEAPVDSAPDPKSVTLRINDAQRTVTTQADSVRAVLAENDVDVDRRDLVVPGLTSPITNDARIQVVTSKTVRIKVGDNGPRARRVAALTVGDALRASDVRVGDDDRVQPGVTKRVKPGMRITVTKIKFKRVTETVNVPFRVKSRPAPALYVGDTQIVRPGKVGRERRVIERKYVNFDLAHSRRIATTTVRKARTQVIKTGTRPRPVATVSGVWARLAQCESGGNPRIVSSNGLYHGLFQFSVGTWQSVGGSGVPSQASAGEQVKRAKILQARSGWGQWPHCSSVLGLR